MRSDLKSIAESHGWSIADAEANYCGTEAVGRVATIVARELPDIFVGSVIPDEPTAPPRLYLKGDTPPRVHELIAAENVPIIIADGHPYSLAELEERKQRVHAAVTALGFTQVATGLAITGRGLIPVSVRRTPGVTDNPDAIMAAIPQDLRTSARITIHDESWVGEDLQSETSAP